jgi:hypothetical protein
MEQEASNPTTKYVLLEDICKQFSQQYMQNILGKTVYSIKPASEPTLYNCTYYLNAQKNDYIMLILDYLNVADQKAGLETLGYTLKTDSRIPMGHFISYNDQGKINDTYFVLGDNKFLRLTRASTQTLTETETLDLSVKLGEKMKNFQ